MNQNAAIGPVNEGKPIEEYDFSKGGGRMLMGLGIALGAGAMAHYGVGHSLAETLGPTLVQAGFIAASFTALYLGIKGQLYDDYMSKIPGAMDKHSAKTAAYVEGIIATSKSFLQNVWTNLKSWVTDSPEIKPDAKEKALTEIDKVLEVINRLPENRMIVAAMSSA